MATTNVGKPFGVVTSKNQATAITESKQDANSGQFYITRTDNSNTGGVGNTEGDASQAISLTINGNVLRGISKDDAIKLANLNIGSGTIAEGAFNYKGSVGEIYDLPTDAKVGDVYNIYSNFQLDNTEFPAYTSVVYVHDINIGTYTWIPLGGKMKISTTATKKISDTQDRIYYSSSDEENTVIGNFDIRVNNDDCLYVADDAIGIKFGPGLSTNDGEYLTPNLGTGLIMQGTYITPSLGEGLSTSSRGYIIPNLGAGLIIRDDYITLDIGTGLTYDDDDERICVNIGGGLTDATNGKIEVSCGNNIIIKPSNSIDLDIDKLSGTVKDVNNFYYSLGGIYFSDTIKSGQKNDNVTVVPYFPGQKKNYGLALRCGTGLAFQEGYEDFGIESSQILGHDGRYYVNIDNVTIGLNTDSKLKVKHDSTLSESGNGLSVKVGHGLVTGGDGININLASPIPSDLQQLPVSTAGILVNDGTNGLCVDIPALKRLVELIMAAK